MADPLSHASAKNIEGNQIGSLPLRSLQSGKECGLHIMRERSGNSTYRVREDYHTMLTDGLVFSRKTTGPEGGQVRRREQLEQTLEDMKQLGMVREP